MSQQITQLIHKPEVSPDSLMLGVLVKIDIQYPNCFEEIRQESFMVMDKLLRKQTRRYLCDLFNPFSLLKKLPTRYRTQHQRAAIINESMVTSIRTFLDKKNISLTIYGFSEEELIFLRLKQAKILTFSKFTQN